MICPAERRIVRGWWAGLLRTSLARRLQAILSEGRLQSRVLRGGAWLIVADLAARGAGLIKMAVLARLLSPADFGLVALSNLVCFWFDAFSQTGFSRALVRKQGDIKPYLNTFWTAQAVRGFMLAAAFFVSSPLIAWLLGNAGLVPILRATSLVLIVRGLWNPAVVYLRKDLKIEREVAWRIGGSLTGLIVAIPLAFLYRNAWALVISALAGNAAELVLSYFLVRFRPRVELSWAKVRELTRFGKWIFWSNMVSYANAYADTWVVGRFLGAAPVGYYQLAQQFGSLPMMQVGSHIGMVTFPAFSQLRDRKAARNALLRSMRFVSNAMLPAAAMLTVFAPLIVSVMLGRKWDPVAPLLAMLACGSAVMALGAVVQSFLQAVDRPRLATQGVLVKLLVFAALVYPLARRYGASGVALAAMLSSPVSFGYQYFEAARILGWGWDFVLVFRQALIGCLPFAAAAALLPFSHHVWSTAALVSAALLAFAGIFLRQLRTLL